ncbi:MAG: hypothetical protein HOM11_13230 [Methylococcales bacterium]|nr:hypothetical protein [Methylococcales bacterium]MBT7445103.1 hypothetical protein [Methylococcales bacterium]
MRLVGVLTANRNINTTDNFEGVALTTSAISQHNIPHSSAKDSSPK